MRLFLSLFAILFSVGSSFAETLITTAKALEMSERGLVLLVGTEPLVVEDTPETKWWKNMASAERGAFKPDDVVHVRIKTDSDPPMLREIADPKTAAWLDSIRKTAKRGSVDKADAKYLTIKFDDGTSFKYRITDKSEIKLKSNPNATLSDLKQGMTIWIKGRLLPSLDTWVVEITDEAPPAKEAAPSKSSTPKAPKPKKPIAIEGTLTGIVVGVNAKFRIIDLDVQGRLLHVTTSAATQFFLNGKLAVAPSIVKGQRAFVTYKRDKSGRIIASRVELS